MLTAPGVPMLDSKLFVTRTDGAFQNLFERWWDGEEWIWVDHGRPGGIPVIGAPGAGMLNSKLFVVIQDGRLFERVWTGSQWVWTDHGRPANRPIVAGPGAEMMASKLFVVADDGRLWERHWRPDLNRWAWEDHGRPPGGNGRTAPGAAMLDQKLFLGTDDGRLVERWWNGSAWVWVDHGRPPGTTVATAPGAAMMGRKLFVGASDGRLFERYWNGSAWVWVDHGRPPGTTVATDPGAAMMNAKLFVGGANGHLLERYWNGSAWVWVDHGAPPGTAVATAPGAAMMSSKLFVGARNGHLFERYWNGSAWQWVDHGTARQDSSQHVIGAPGTSPKLEIAILGDGYAEADLNAYQTDVDNLVLSALRRDQFAGQQNRMRVVRIDVLSVESGVTERRYNADGTLQSETYRQSRLGTMPNASWDRGWFDLSPFTAARVEKLRRRFAPAARHVVVLANSGTYGGVVGPSGVPIGLFTRGGGWELIAHEFGHELFQLGDEYLTSGKTDAFTGAAGQANLSEQPASWAALKWSALVAAGTPLPTSAGSLPAGWNRRTSVGAFEGAGGRFATGLFRPVLECRMNQNDPPWCPVCAGKITADLSVFSTT